MIRIFVSYTHNYACVSQAVLFLCAIYPLANCKICMVTDAHKDYSYIDVHAYNLCIFLSQCMGGSKKTAG